MTAQVVRRVRLPADHSSPAAARLAVRSVISDVGLGELTDEALLLTTELTTNAIVHAGTEVDLEIVGDRDSLTVTVMDFLTGPLTDSRWGRPRGGQQTGELEERGRGLLLVDQLSACWGTLHHRAGKGVWFRLDRPERKGEEVTAGLRAPSFAALLDLASEQPMDAAAPALPERNGGRPAGSSAASSAAGGPGEGVPSGRDALVALAREPDLGEGAPLSVVGEDLLGRLCPVVGAGGAALLVDEGDGRGTRTVAAYGLPAGYGVTRRIALRLSRPWQGELVLARTGAGYSEPLATLAAQRLSLLVDNDRLRRAETEQRNWLTYLAEVSQLLAQSLDVELTLALIPQLVVPRLGQWCAVHTADDAGELHLAAASHADEAALPTLTDQLDQALPQLRDALQVDAAVPLAAPVEGYAVALAARGQLLGTLSVGRGASHRHSGEELAVLEDVARRSAVAIDNARIHAERRAVAHALQRSLLPPALPEVSGIDFGAEYVPTGEGVDVGGDFYDVVALPDQRWLVVVGDVSGKGVQAAAITGLVRDVTRVLVRDGRPLAEALARLNETLVERGGGRFCTLALASVSRQSGGRLDISLYLAGHDKPVLLQADGTTSLVGTCGTALGLLNAVSSPAARLSLDPGDTLVFYTDGVTERRRGSELFGVRRLCREAAALAGFPAEVVAAGLRTAALSFSREAPRDDIAILALRNDAAPAG